MTSSPETHQPDVASLPGAHKLVLSEHHRGEGLLATIADLVNRFVGSMWVFVAVTFSIVFWLFAGNVIGFDKTPWPLLLTILNLPQLLEGQNKVLDLLKQELRKS